MSEQLPGQLSGYDFFTAIWRLLAQAQSAEPAQGKSEKQAPVRMPGAGGPLSQEPIRLKVSPEMSFPASELASVEGPDDEGRVTLTTHLPGLHGALSPLPLSYVTEVLQGLEDEPQLAGFLDLLHHRLLGLLYRGVVQHHPERMWTGDGNDDFSHILTTLSRQNPELVSSDVPTDMREFTGLFFEPYPTADGLEQLISHQTGLKVEVESLVGHSVELPDAVLPRLGDDSVEGRLRSSPYAQFRLGQSLLGDRLFDRSLRLGVHLEVDAWEVLTQLQPGGESHAALRGLIRQYVGPLLDVVLVFHLPSSRVPVPVLGGDVPVVLGADLPIGTLTDDCLTFSWELKAVVSGE